MAARACHLPVLEALRSAGCEFETQEASQAAALEGHPHLVAWMVEELGAPLDERLLTAAAESGSVGLLASLRERGWPWDAAAFAAPAKSGCVAALEWLAGHGCPTQMHAGVAFVPPAVASDLAMLERLGCPWGPPGKLSSQCVSDHGCRMSVLASMVEAGCLVDWAEALEAAEELVLWYGTSDDSDAVLIGICWQAR
ncbi:hypothetical protein GPECTOR_11g134 [Gonium pectorale]|uniref:Ankyrin repeat domain-containing protein n=1 Tax=Gonium pectorale TaxID=33097 RepID=A0A150GPC1_GONPE|nr:hypothetical protein GPECTOR_11g134 [Gonium pectorale]|eukprot:KXZ51683.1 hypothetical protein GPECTOR_11g134 [Gonium pectorale]